MSSAWMTFQSAGPFGFGILACAVVSLVVALAAVVVAFATKRAGPWTSAAALLLSGAGLALGGVGTWLSRGKVDAALAGASIEWSKLEEIYVEGYREARDVSVVAAVLLALPLLLSLVAAGAAVARARLGGAACRASARRPGHYWQLRAARRHLVDRGAALG